MDEFEDFDGDDAPAFRPPPHRDDRLWRHPAEVAAEAAAAARAEPTVELPAIADDQESPAATPAITMLETTPADAPRRGRRPVALAMAGSMLVVGGAALALGLLSSPTNVQTADRPAAAAAPRVAATSGAAAAAETRPVAYANPERKGAASLHQSLPRVQAATAGGMREGAGIVVAPHGTIATSASLIADADYVLVWTADGARHEASVLAHDPATDVAVIRIDSSPPVAVLLTQRPAATGEESHSLDADGVLRVGTVTSASVAARSDGSPSSARFSISDDAAVPGAAVLDGSGRVIGMANGRAPGAVGDSLATPAWMLEPVVAELVRAGTANHTVFGAHLEVRETDAGSSIAVIGVNPNSPAHRHGLQAGDVIHEVNGTVVNVHATVWTAVATEPPGSTVDLSVVRAGEHRVISVTTDSPFD